VNELLHELATLGLAMGALVLLGTCVYLAQRNVRTKFSHQRDQHTRQILLALLFIVCLGSVAWLIPVIDASRRPLFDYVGILLAVACLCAAVVLALDLLAGLQLRLRSVVPAGAWIRAGEYAGQISRRGLLQVVITTAGGDSVHLPNRYLLRMPIHLVSSGSISADVKNLLHDTPADSVSERAAVPAVEPATGFWPASVAPVVAERREPILTATELATETAEPVTFHMTTDLVDAELVKPVQDPHMAAEVAQLKSEYTALSQQLLDVERALQAAEQGEERQPLSLEKKKMEARLVRLDKQISQLETGERRRA
jgi:hypothetical protein